MLIKIIDFVLSIHCTYCVILWQIWLIMKNGFSYFYSPKWRTLPPLVHKEEFGTHKFAHLKSKINLHYVESGDPSKPLMLFLHGFQEFWYSWRHQITAFKDSYRIVAVDMRGYGLSDKPQDVASYKMPLLVNDVKELLDFLGCDKCTLVAHHWGGSVAWSFAMRYPEHLSALVVMNCPHDLAFKHMKWGNLMQSLKEFLDVCYKFYFLMPYIPEWVMSRFDFESFKLTSQTEGLRVSELSAEEQVAYKAILNMPGALTAAINYYRAAFRYRNEIKLPNKGHINDAVPVLLIFGDRDAVISEAAMKASGHYCTKNMELQVIPGSSRWVQQDIPRPVNSAMSSFFQRHSI